MKRREETEKAAFDYINSDAVSPENMKLAFGDFINGAKWADKTNALELFKKLPHLDYNKNVLTDWGYTPNLYHFDESWHVSWVECEDGETLIDFEAETPEEAIQKAFDWCVELKLIEK